MTQIKQTNSTLINPEFNVNASICPYSKDHPFLASMLERYILNRSGSSKATYHIRLDIKKSGICYRPGDAIAVLPSNDPTEVNQLLDVLDLAPDTCLIDPRSQVQMSAHHYLTHKVNLRRVSKKLLEFLNLEGEFHTLHDCFKPNRIYCLQDIAQYLSPLLPRYYSIASATPDHIDLIVATFSYQCGGIERPGIGSHFLCELVNESTQVPIYLHPTKNFLLPQDSETPIIMIGPGTGVAPFRAFLQARKTGRNWLFFGERQSKFDFYYEDELKAYVQRNQLVLTTAFSRDQPEKIYVQHRIQEHADQVKAWLRDGAFVYICGDAKRMAKSVLEALNQITDLKELRQEKRIFTDVY